MASEIKLLFDAMAAKGYDEFYSQLLHEAFSETKEAAKAIKVANSIFAKENRPKPALPPVINVPAPVVTISPPVIPAPVIHIQEKERPKRSFEILHADGERTVITEL